MNHLVTKSSRVLLDGASLCLRSRQPILTRAFSFTPRVRQNSSNENQDFRHSEDLAQERYDLRADEPIDKKRARLLYQSRKRGMLENGVILASFADKFLHTLDAEQLDQYDRLINLPTNDWDIFYWATKTKPTPPEFETPVMQKLRHHMNSKVSRTTDSEHDHAAGSHHHGDHSSPQEAKSGSGRPQDAAGKHLNDIVMPAVRDKYDLEVDFSATSLTDYEQELFDNRVTKYPNKQSMVRMTEWRKGYFLKRLRRTLPAPISVRNLDESKQVEVFTQKATGKNIATNPILQTDLIDSSREKKLKHHNLLQHLLGSKFTDNVHEYDDEAEAWAEMLWHRSYGSADVSIAPSNTKCANCLARLHCCDPGLSGYLPKELFAKLATKRTSADNDQVQCQKCQFKSVYNVSLGAVDMSGSTFAEVLREYRHLPPSIICLLIDLTDFPSGIWEGLIDLVGIHHKIIVVGNKLDLLPNDGLHMLERVTSSLKQSLSILRPGQRNLYIQDVMVLSARTGFGVEGLVSRLHAMSNERPMEIHLVGCSNSGKSTLFNALLQSDLCAIRHGDLMGRVSPYECPAIQSLKLLRFPIARLDGWEIELKKRKTERVERNTAMMERSLNSTTRARQATTPHVSLLVDRTEYPPSNHHSASIIRAQDVNDESEQEPMFSEDHPLQISHDREPLSATREEFNENGFLHQTPSSYHPDQLHELLTNDERLEVFPHETIIPRKYSLRPLQSIFLAGLARLDLLTANSTVQITIFASRYLPIHVIATRKADQFYNEFLGTPYLGVPFGDQQRLSEWPKLVNSAPDFHIRGINWRRGAADVVFSSAGWALVTLAQDQECIVRAFTPDGRGIFMRHQPLLPYGSELIHGKIRDTPLFRHPHYTIERRSA